MWAKKSSDLFKNVMYGIYLQIIYIFNIYMYKEDLALNNLQWLICHKTKSNQTKPVSIFFSTFLNFPVCNCFPELKNLAEGGIKENCILFYIYIYIYIYIHGFDFYGFIYIWSTLELGNSKVSLNHHHHHHQHHQCVLRAQIPLTLSCHLFLYVIALIKSSLQHSTKCFTGFSTLVYPCVGVHLRMSLMSLSLLHLQCPTCLIWMVCVMGGKWPYSCCFVGCCFQELFKIACNIFC